MEEVLAISDADSFVEFTVASDADFLCVDDWTAAQTGALSALAGLCKFEPAIPTLPQLYLPSLTEMVETEIANVLAGRQRSEARSVSELKTLRDAEISAWESERLKVYFANDKKSELKSLKFQLPHINEVARDPYARATWGGKKTVVSFQIYKTINFREIKLFQLDLLAEQSLQNLFDLLTSLLPAGRMFDGPSYADSGMILIGETMYVTGVEDYSAPCKSWLDQHGITGYSTRRMEEVSIGQMPGLPRIIANSDCCYLIFCGNEELKMFVSNMTANCPTDNLAFPVITYKRKPTRLNRCILCKSRLAELIVLNDDLLPKNPSHACNACYRRLRSDRAGEFVLPPEDVIVSALVQI